MEDRHRCFKITFCTDEVLLQEWKDRLDGMLSDNNIHIKRLTIQKPTESPYEPKLDIVVFVHFVNRQTTHCVAKTMLVVGFLHKVEPVSFQSIKDQFEDAYYKDGSFVE